jgi:hypothetical protein
MIGTGFVGTWAVARHYLHDLRRYLRSKPRQLHTGPLITGTVGAGDSRDRLDPS